jgi:hypothetical protein
LHGPKNRTCLSGSPDRAVAPPVAPYAGRIRLESPDVARISTVRKGSRAITSDNTPRRTPTIRLLAYQDGVHASISANNCRLGKLIRRSEHGGSVLSLHCSDLIWAIGCGLGQASTSCLKMLSATSADDRSAR